MKLLMFWHAGGVPSYFERYKQLAKYYKDVVVVIPNHWNEGGKKLTNLKEIQLLDNCKIIPIKTKFYSKQTTLIYSKREVKNILKSFDPDVVHIHEEPWAFSCFQLIKQCKKIMRNRGKIIVDSAAINLSRTLFPFSYIEKNTYKNVDFIFARNKEVIEILKQRGYKGPTHLLGNGVDTKLFKASPIPFQNKNDIIFVGRIIESKGIFTLLDAFKELIHSETQYEGNLIFLGDGSDKKELEERTINYKLTERVKFFSRVDSTEVSNYIQDARALVLPSISTKLWKEQFGRVIIEALVVGRPVIGSTCGEIPNVIGNNEYIFTENNVEELFSKMRYIISEKFTDKINEDLTEMRNKAIDKYDWASLAKYHYKINLER
ncbi:hypothetical protein GZ22_15740 [Terribacillus saccharophilus]|uniref:Glycosyl transferase family 1 domain-containing protein n=1 Tax=Terribacillus saccharophilus TaxID=361277 RepID=A0A075LMF2_9BACI|nr:glycosyltransferase family 4 protein [Terribacillus goriensis]AIF67940.1 hypothetical protein GZ22_15740 [Terribacillus goriensis]